MSFSPLKTSASTRWGPSFPKLCGKERNMKLLKWKACLWAFDRGNGIAHKTWTVMGETVMDGSSDRGSIPLSSIYIKRNIEVWLSLVERHVRDVEAASSNLVTSISKAGINNNWWPVFYFFNEWVKYIGKSIWLIKNYLVKCDSV